MTRKKKIVIATAAVLGAYVGWQVVVFFGSEAALMERFSDLDPETVKRAHREMWRRAMKHDPVIANATSEAELDELFMIIVNNQ